MDSYREKSPNVAGTILRKSGNDRFEALEKEV